MGCKGAAKLPPPLPFFLPGLIIYQLLHEKIIDRKTTLWALQQLAEFISGDEYSTIRLFMENGTGNVL